MTRDLHSVHTMCDEGNKFVAKHPELNQTQATWGAVTWGLLRALMECPNCPGEFRVPRLGIAKTSEVEVEVLWCAKCGGQWIHRDDLAKLKPEQAELF